MNQKILFLSGLLSCLLWTGCVGFYGTRGFKDSRPLIPLNENNLQIESMNVSSDGTFLAVGYSGTGAVKGSPVLRVWTIDQDIPQLLGAKRVNDLKILKPEFSYDGKTLFVAEQNGLMKINMAEFPLRPEEATTRTVSDSVRILSQWGNYAATVSPEGQWAILNVKTQTSQPIQFGDIDRVLAFSDSGKFIAVREATTAETPRGKEQINIWSLSTNPTLSEISKVSEIDIEHFASGELCCFSPDDTTLAVVNRTGVLGLWNVRTGRLIDELRQNEAITAFAFSPQEKRIAVCTSGPNAKLTLWDINRAKIVQTQTDSSTDAMTAVVFSPDGKFIYTGDKNGNIKKWPVKTK
ncbi:MAG: hypothetical protein FWC43_11490 [Planctomycetaceae bacterium]|nr:hypothetical protein [Planctomycetaceae bacterium]